jgi:hypothetical protein
MTGDTVVSMPADPCAQEDILARIDNSVSCVVVQSPDVFGNPRDLAPIAEKAHAHGALLIAVFTEAVSLGAADAAGRDGRGHRRRRGPVDRQCAEFRRALCRPVRDKRRNICGRCRAASAARRWTRRAGAASC